MTKRKILLVNDSYFAYQSSKELIAKFSNEIEFVVFSNSKSSVKGMSKILKKVSIKYFVYRVFIHFLSIFFLKKKSVKYLTKKHNIKSFVVSSRKELMNLISEKSNSDIAFAFNFDIIINRFILDEFKKGIYNIHASKLPKDRGVSPVLWAFARGDKTIWSTIYKMNEGIDTGDICKQIDIDVYEFDTVFSIYKRVSHISGKLLCSIVEDLTLGKILLKQQPTCEKPNYCTWPNKEFDYLMKSSERKMIKLNDLTNSFKD